VRHSELIICKVEGIDFHAAQRDGCLLSVGVLPAGRIERIADWTAREGQLQMFRLRFAALNMTSGFAGRPEMRGSLEIGIFVVESSRRTTADVSTSLRFAQHDKWLCHCWWMTAGPGVTPNFA
jgi:hypothetical protein